MTVRTRPGSRIPKKFRHIKSNGCICNILYVSKDYCIFCGNKTKFKIKGSRISL